MAVCALVTWGMAAAPAFAAKDRAIIARNILPSGQYQLAGPGAADQAQLYNGLTPLFDRIGNSDLFTYFKSERLEIEDGPTTSESVPFGGVTILRDRFNVPHIYSQTRRGGIQAAGWVLAQDRGLLLEQARYNARVAAIDAPGLSAIELVSTLQNFRPSAQTESFLAQQTKVLQRHGKEGRALLRDIDAFLEGINAQLAATQSPSAAWTRNDVYAVNALKGQFLGQGGGDEARRSEFLNGLQKQLGARGGFAAYNDLRQFKNPKSVTTVEGKFPYGAIPRSHPGSVVLDHKSFQETPAVPPTLANRLSSEPPNASNVLMVAGDRSTTGHPIMVGGPQISYFMPGLVYEMDMHAPKLNWRGATSAPFPGYLLIGRTDRFATTLTSAGADIIDQYAETLCGDGSTMYRYKGKCRSMGRFDAGTLNGQPVSFLTTVHGPVAGYATVGGRRVAISSKRSSRGRDVVDQLFFRRVSSGQVKSPEDFLEAASLTPQTFNSFYLDNQHFAEFTSGRLPIRNPKVDPGLPTKGTGKYEWMGFLAPEEHPQGVDNRRGFMTNWNNGAARGFGAADDSWGRNGSVGRNNLLNFNLKRLGRNGKWSPASVTAAMNAAATQDVRAIVMVPLLARLLQGTPAPSAQAQQMLDLLEDWRAAGGNRLDLSGDGKIDHPGAAIMDGAYPLIVGNALAKIAPLQPELDSLFSRFDAPPDGQFSGWYQYFDRDIRALLAKRRLPDQFRLAYCGNGSLGACRQSIWAAIQAAAEQLATEQGTPIPSLWRADATAEEIKFTPLPLITMRYTNRPSGIQQVISFGGKPKKEKKRGKGKTRGK
ncbi:MAG: penicillin acylase family protein [Solirubrobacterales bacterium]